MARVRITRSMTRKNGTSKATISKFLKVESSPNKVTISQSKKVGPSVKS